MQQPGDFLLQLDVAVANIGGRKALLSSLHLLRFHDDRGEAVGLPEVPLPIAAQRYQQRFRWVGRERLRDAEVTFPRDFEQLTEGVTQLPRLPERPFELE
jgi:hypothetical protein